MCKNKNVSGKAERMYLTMCAKLFKIMNNSTEIDPSSYRELIKMLISGMMR